MEVRGEGGCFMNAIRALFNTIRNRFKPQRARQRTKNYRICRNLAMAKIEPEKKKRARKQLRCGLNASIKKQNQAAHVNMAQRRVQKEDGAPGDLQKRIRSSQRALQEKRKPYWVLHRGWKQCSMVDLNMEIAQVEQRPQPAKVVGEKPNMEGAQAREEPQLSELSNDKANKEDNQALEDLQSCKMPKRNMEDALADEEPAIWVVAHAQMWKEMTGISHQLTGSGSVMYYPVPAEWALDHLMKAQSSSENKERGEQGLGSFKEDEAGEDLQAAEPASWVAAYGNMWQEMTKFHSSVLCSGPGPSYSATSTWVLDHLMEAQRSSEKEEGGEQGDTPELGSFKEDEAGEDLQAAEPASWVAAYGNMWQDMTKHQSSVLCYGFIYSATSAWALGRAQSSGQSTGHHGQ